MASRGSQRQIIDSCSVMTISGGRRNLSANSTVKGGGVGNDGRYQGGSGRFGGRTKKLDEGRRGTLGLRGQQ